LISAHPWDIGISKRAKGMRDRPEEASREEGKCLRAKRIELAGRKNCPIFYGQKKLN